jgi:hypothetical protein
MTNGVIVMTQYLLALYMADDFHYSPEQTQQVWDGVVALNDRMTDAGAFVFQDGLHGGPEAATVVRQSGDDFVLTDGPYAETKEHLAGFWIINAADLDAALEWAKQATVACLRPIEVRPFFDGDLEDVIDINRTLDETPGELPAQ